MPKLIILRGLPGSGKTKTAVELVDKDSWLVRVCNEDISYMLYRKPFLTQLDRFQHDNVTLTRKNTVDNLLKAGLSVVDDNLNLDSESVKSLYAIANKYKAEVEIIDHDLHFEECIKFSRRKDGMMFSEEYFRDLVKRFTKKGHIRSAPTNKPAEEMSGKHYTPNPDLPKAVWVDADGTFFSMDPKLRGPFEFHKVHLDTPFQHIVDLCTALKNDGYKIVVMSGRDESCWQATFDCFVSAGVTPDDMFLRPNNTKDIKDYEIKEQLFWKYVAPKYDIRFALDDRQSVVDYTREVLGIPVLQVARGDF